jgi:hypothetical protein
MSRHAPFQPDKPTGIEQLQGLSKQKGVGDDAMSARMLAIIYAHATSNPISPDYIMGMIDNAQVSPEVGFEVLKKYDEFIQEVGDMDPSSSARKHLKDEHAQLVNDIGALSAQSTKPQNQKLWAQLSDLADDFSRHLSKGDNRNPLPLVFTRSGERKPTLSK